MPVLVEIQYCKNCHFHTWCSHHDEIKYINFFQQLSQRITSVFPDVKVIQRDAPPELERKLHSAVEENKYVNTQTGEIVIFPRTGAFQVYADGYRIYSKIKRKMWPKFDKIIETLGTFLQAKTKNQNLGQFDVDYVDPSTKPLSITNSEPHDLHGLFRVRRHKHQGTPIGLSVQKRFSERNSPKITPQMLSNRSAEKKVLFFQESESQDKIKRIHGWQPLSTKAKNVYLREIYAKGGIIGSEKKKPKIKLIKDELRGSITIQNGKGEKQIYFKALNRKSRQNSGKRKKLIPLQDSPLLDKYSQSVPRLQENIHGAEPLLFNEFNAGLRPGLYRDRKFLTKKKKEGIKINTKFQKKAEELHSYDEFLEELKKDPLKSKQQEQTRIKKTGTLDSGKKDDEYEVFDEDFQKEQISEAENEFMNANDSSIAEKSVKKQKQTLKENESLQQDFSNHSFDHKQISDEENPEKVEEIEEMDEEIVKKQIDEAFEEKKKIKDQLEFKVEDVVIQQKRVQKQKQSKKLRIQQAAYTNNLRNLKQIQPLKKVNEKKRSEIKQKLESDFLKKGQFEIVANQKSHEWYASYDQAAFQLIQNGLNDYEAVEWYAQIEDGQFQMAENSVHHQHEWHAELEDGQFRINESQVGSPDYEWDAYFSEKPTSIIKPIEVTSSKSTKLLHNTLPSNALNTNTGNISEKSNAPNIPLVKKQSPNFQKGFGSFQIVLNQGSQFQWNASYDQAAFQLIQNGLNDYEAVEWYAQIEDGQFQMAENSVHHQHEWHAELEDGQFRINESQVGSPDYEWDAYFSEKPSLMVKPFKQFSAAKIYDKQEKNIFQSKIDHEIYAQKFKPIKKETQQAQYRQKQQPIKGQFEIALNQQHQMSWHAQYGPTSFELLDEDVDSLEVVNWEAELEQGDFRLIENSVVHEHEWYAQLEEGQFRMIEKQVGSPDFEWDAYLFEKPLQIAKQSLFSEKPKDRLRENQTKEKLIIRQNKENKIEQIKQKKAMTKKLNFSNQKNGQFNIFQCENPQQKWYAQYDEAFNLYQQDAKRYDVVKWQAQVEDGRFMIEENSIHYEHQWYAALEDGQFKMIQQQVRSPDYEWNAYLVQIPGMIIKPMQQFQQTKLQIRGGAQNQTKIIIQKQQPIKGQFEIALNQHHQMSWHAQYGPTSFELLDEDVDSLEVVNWEAELEQGDFRLIENSVVHEHEWYAQLEEGQFRILEKQVESPDFEWDAYLLEKPSTLVGLSENSKRIVIAAK